MRPLDPDPPGRGVLVDLDVAQWSPFGRGAYSDVLALQERLRERRRTAGPDVWLVGEHPLVITQGVRARAEDFRPGPAPTPAPVFRIDRGGMTTLHSPGQLILYPIVKLKAGSLAAGRFARLLLEGLARWLEDEFGITPEAPARRAGLFVDGRKLLSLGLSARSGVTMHGAALNCVNDLSLWDTIVACGEPATRPTSLTALLGRPVPPSELHPSLQAWLARYWGYRRLQPRPVELGAPARPGASVAELP